MKKTITFLLVIFFVLSLFGSVAGAQSPVVGGVTFSFEDVQKQLLNAQMRLAEMQAKFTEVKMALSEAEIDALVNMIPGGWFPVAFQLPPTFDGQQFNWVSSNSNVATVVFLGSRSLILAQNPGTAVITVSTADNRFNYSFTVVVK